MPRPSDMVNRPLDRAAVIDLYSRFRPGMPGPPSDEEITSHLGNPGGYRGVVNTLATSEEGLARGISPRDLYRRSTPTTAPPTDTTAAAALGRRGWTNADGVALGLDTPVSGGSGAEWAGFNIDRAAAGGDDASVKDAFYRWTWGLDFNPDGKSKEEIETYLRSQLDGARAYGLNILDVKGEQVLIETKERGAEWVDVVQGAGAPGAKWQWLTQVEFGTPAPGKTGLQTREPDPARQGPLPEPTTNTDGTYSIRVSPEVYRSLQLQLNRRRNRRGVGDMVAPAVEPVP